MGLDSRKATGASSNLDVKTVEGFGDEWAAFDQSGLTREEHEAIFNDYFAVFPWDQLPEGCEGFDLGCGSGRWAVRVAPRVGQLHCIDAATAALEVAKAKMSGMSNVSFHLASVDAIPLKDNSQDFGFSLGVLHHVPNTAGGIAACVRKLKPCAPFLVYLYYRFDNRPAWFRGLWRLSEVPRRVICVMPFALKRPATDIIAALVYLPLSRIAKFGEAMGASVGNWPLSAYRDRSFYTLRTDALDRFGTRLEQRFTRVEIDAMMRAAGLDNIRFHDGMPYWVAIGFKSKT
ncbi:MAG: class I SAM-dependent methyltransferase [Hyphomicrobium sp.]